MAFLVSRSRAGEVLDS